MVANHGQVRGEDIPAGPDRSGQDNASGIYRLPDISKVTSPRDLLDQDRCEAF